MAVSYNWLSTKRLSVSAENDSSLLKLRFVAPFVSYSFLEKNNLQLCVSLYFGLGQTFNQFKNKEKRDAHFSLNYEPSMKATYRIFKYFGLSAGIGYRLFFINNRFINENFNSPTYTLGVKLFMGDIYTDVKKRLGK